MKQKEVFKKIGGIIQELSEQYEYLETVVDNLNDLELELFVSNAHFLTDHIEILCKLNLQNKPKRALVEKPETYEQKFFEPVVQKLNPVPDFKNLKTSKPPVKAIEIEIVKPAEPEPVKQEEKPIELPAAGQPIAIEEKKHNTLQFDFTSNTPEDTEAIPEPEIEEPETIRHDLILDEADTLEYEPEPLIEEISEAAPEPQVIAEDIEAVPEPEIEEPEPVIESEIELEAEPKASQAEPIAELNEKEPVIEEPAKDESEIITRNQKISSQLGDKASKSEQLSIKPISDIKLAITLNDKLLYVKDLFNGYNLAYSEAIEILNRFNTFEEAQRFLKTNYVTKNNWEGKQATADKFYALLKRRYA